MAIPAQSKRLTSIPPRSRASVDRAVEYRLLAVPTGVVLVRTRQASRLGRIEQFVHFTALDPYLAWAREEGRRTGDPRLAPRLVEQFQTLVAERPTNASAGSGHIADDPVAAFMGFVGRIRDGQSQAAVLSLMHESIGCLGADAGVFVGVLPDDALHRSVWTLIDGDMACQCMHRDDWYLESGSLLSGNGCWCMTTVDWESRGGGHHGSRSAEDFCHRSSVRIALPGTSGLGRYAVMRIGSSSDDQFELHRPGTKLLARSLAGEVQAWWLREAGGALCREASINDFDLQVLAMHHGGASTREIAGSLGMTREKVRRRLRFITAKLRSVDRRAAGQRAAEYGLI